MQRQTLERFLIPLLYTAGILVFVLFQGIQQAGVLQGGSPLYRNLMDYPAYIRHGFDLAEIQSLPMNIEWLEFTAAQLRIRNSPLPDLPQRSFLSPRGLPAQEFTILIPIELDSAALGSAEPGIFLGYIGENWEVYVNGRLVKREMHLDGTGRITSRRNWRSVHFPVDRSFLLEGTNVLAFRIIGDPAYGVTGLYYSSPYYLDEYSLIQRRNLDILSMILCGIFGYTAIYYFIIFLSVRKKEELYNIYYSIASVLLCVYTLMFSGMVNYLIPNSDISIRLEYISLFMLVPTLGLFIEHFGLKKITAITRGFLIVYGILGFTQIFFSNQYGDDVLMIWSATVLLYFSYIFFYNVVNFFIRKKRNEAVDPFVGNILIGLVVVYLCGLYDVLDIIFLHTSSSFFLYSTFIFHLGMAITLSQRYREMYSHLEHSNIILEEKVHERTLELQQASQAKSNFFANMSHEIRTPLNAVIGFSEIELRGRDGSDLAPSTRESFAQIHRSGSFLLDIINEILDISKIESGKLELFPVEYETAPLINNAVSLNRLRIASKENGGNTIRFVLEIDGSFPAKLIGDELRVRQIVNNLLSNAVKHTDNGTIKLSINSKQLTEKSLITFTVTDTGIGIRPEDRDKLFDTYSQLDTGKARTTEGTGLGLSITKNLAEMMGGGISVESTYGKGSCFTAWIIQEFPCSKDDSQPLCIGEEVAEVLRSFRYDMQYREADITPIDLPGGRILVVDDIPENLMVVRGFLQPYGIHIDTAGGGQEAIELVQKYAMSGENYNLIFMDHMMPEMDGVATLKAIREQGSQVPIIVLTSNALRGMNEFYMEHGFQDFLTKPVNPQELDKMLRKWLEQGSEGRIQESADSGLTLPHVFAAELNARKLDRLRHFCFAFESGREIDTDYFQKFTAFTETLDTDDPLAASLTNAGHNEDAETIRRILPAFCQAMEKQLAMNNEQLTDGNNVREMIGQIKQAILDGDHAAAKKIRKAMGVLKLPPVDRELYFKLYEASMLDDNAQALKAIEEWEKL